MALIDSESSRVVGSGEVALWRAVIEQALNDACLLRLNPGVNRNPTPASRERDRVRAMAGDWFKSDGPDFQPGLRLGQPQRVRGGGLCPGRDPWWGFGVGDAMRAGLFPDFLFQDPNGAA